MIDKPQTVGLGFWQEIETSNQAGFRTRQILRFFFAHSFMVGRERSYKTRKGKFAHLCLAGFQPPGRLHFVGGQLIETEAKPMNALALIPQDAIKLNNNRLCTDSKKVAEAFGKQHQHVTQKIESLDCSERFLTSNFSLVTHEHKGNSYKLYEITKDGFMFLVMGFTGAKAGAIKEAFIDAFNAMAEQLARPAQVPITDLAPIDVQACMLSELQSTKRALSPELIQAIGEQTAVLTKEAQEHIFEHLYRKACYVGGAQDPKGAIRVIKHVTLNYALAYAHFQAIEHLSQMAMILKIHAQTAQEKILAVYSGQNKLN